MERLHPHRAPGGWSQVPSPFPLLPLSSLPAAGVVFRTAPTVPFPSVTFNVMRRLSFERSFHSLLGPPFSSPEDFFRDLPDRRVCLRGLIRSFIPWPHAIFSAVQFPTETLPQVSLFPASSQRVAISHRRSRTFVFLPCFSIFAALGRAVPFIGHFSCFMTPHHAASPPFWPFRRVIELCASPDIFPLFSELIQKPTPGKRVRSFSRAAFPLSFQFGWRLSRSVRLLLPLAFFEVPFGRVPQSPARRP